MTERQDGKRRSSATWVGTIVLAAFALVLGGLGREAPAVAQESGSEGNFLLLRQLFRVPGERRVERPAKQKPAAARARKKKPRKKPKAPAASVVRQAPPEPARTKNADARTVLVVGDFLAGSLAEGLEQALSEDLTIKVVSRSEGDSGLVRDDVVNWPARVGELIDEEKPVAVVAMLGSNDRQAMRVDGASAAPRSPEWTAAYRERARSLGEAAAQRGVPLLWVGLPSFKFSKMSADILAFNDLYRQAAESTGGEFIDIWEGFVDETGAFTATGPDVNGQPARLRGSDGINMTSAGKRKLAFYVEKPLQKLLNASEAEAVAALPSPAAAPFIGPPLPPSGPVNRTQPIALNAPRAGETELLSVAQPAAAAPAGAQEPVAVPPPAPQPPEPDAPEPETKLAPSAPPGPGAAVYGRADNFFAIR
ncbi:MAG TPA: SGNH family hydrolase [Mesorhizobium sp.]|jgi:hypothetical protein|nr:SGNH family hydrolase [Mesorhizobium sp.]